MKKVAIVLLVGILVAGCSMFKNLSSRQNARPDASRTFFDRTITYTVDYMAQEYMSKAESLLGQTRQEQAPLSDQVVLPLYRSTDIDRDHFITVVEAKAFYHDFVLKFEDSLGTVQLGKN